MSTNDSHPENPHTSSPDRDIVDLTELGRALATQAGVPAIDLLGNFARQFGLRFQRLDRDGIRADWNSTPELHQPYEIVHGGAHCSVVETLASLGAGLWLGVHGRALGINNSTDFLRAAPTGALTSEATPLHRGRSQQLWEVRTQDTDGRLVTRGQVRFQNLSQSTTS